MKLAIETAFIAFSLFAAVAYADAPIPKEIEDPECLGINKEPWHATLMPYADLKEALAARRHASTFCRSLNGTWKFNWVKRPELRPADFYKPDFDVSGWKDIPVPSCFQVLGYGTPYYRNLGYIFQKDFPHVMSEPPKNFTAYDERNPVGSYRRTFDVPKDWDGRRIFMTFDGVDSAFFLWINGQQVGYSVNSRNAAEFDVTKYVKPGENMVAVEVYRFSAGSFLEDQDMWRLSGIFRNVTIWSTPQVHVRDFYVKTDLDSQYKDATLNLAAKVKNYGAATPADQTLTATLYDVQGKKVDEKSVDVGAVALQQEKTVDIKMPVADPAKWTAETPNLYTLVMTLQPKNGKPDEILSSRVGFRKVEIKGRIFMVNGVPVKLKGVNRHEHWPDVGHAVTEAQMIRDLEVIKQGNCNHVRTCHYSDDPRWYELCDQYGIWLVAEANCECHGYDRRFDEEPRMHEAIVDRNRANVENHKNHPSVVIWSLGNECGGRGTNFLDAEKTVKAIDPTRPVHYERFGKGPGNPSDFDQQMYGTPEDFEHTAKDKNLTKPFYICEYAHAMFNSMGSLADYNEVFDRNPEIAGAAIWEFQDQGLWNRRDPKHPILAYGGGFGEFPNDHYFIHKGVVASDRSPKPHYVEMKRAYQWIDTSLGNPAAGTIKIHNKFQFIDLSGLNAAWSITEDGVEIQHDNLTLPEIGPGKEATVTVPYDKFVQKAGAEYFLRVSFTLAKDQLWAKKGFEVAAEQFPWLIGGQIASDTPQVTKKPVTLTQNDDTVIVAGDGFKVTFDKRTGVISALERDGQNILAKDGGPRLHLWRAPHRNDDMWAYGSWQSNGFVGLKLAPVSVEAKVLGANRVQIISVLKNTPKNGKQCRVTHKAIYTITGDGVIDVVNDVDFNKHSVVLGRLGVRMLLDKRLNHFDFFGRGPMENYSDRKTGSDIGLYGFDITKQYMYEKPMEEGNHEDVRWAALTGGDLPGLLAKANGATEINKTALPDGLTFFKYELLQASALPWTDEQMTDVEYKIDLPPSTATVFCLSAKTLGAGSAGCGPRPLDKYVVRSRPATFSYALRLLPAGQKPTPEITRQPVPQHNLSDASAAAPARKHIPHPEWKVVSATSFEPGEGELRHLIDGNPATFWHSRWSKNPTKNPHAVVIDFGSPQEIAAVAYTPRQEQQNGRVKEYKVFFSMDGKSWGKPAIDGDFEDEAEEQIAPLPNPTTARFMKFVVISEVRSQPFASIAELDIIPAK